MAIFKVQYSSGRTELIEATRNTKGPTDYFTRDTRAKIGDTVMVENGLGLKLQAVRIPQYDKPEINLRKIIGNAIKEAREYRGLTQDELAERIGTSKKYLQMVEQGLKNITADQIQKIITAANVNKVELKMR